MKGDFWAALHTSWARFINCDTTRVCLPAVFCLVLAMVIPNALRSNACRLIVSRQTKPQKHQQQERSKKRLRTQCYKSRKKGFDILKRGTFLDRNWFKRRCFGLFSFWWGPIFLTFLLLAKPPSSSVALRQTSLRTRNIAAPVCHIHLYEAFHVTLDHVHEHEQSDRPYTGKHEWRNFERVVKVPIVPFRFWIWTYWGFLLQGIFTERKVLYLRGDMQITVL